VVCHLLNRVNVGGAENLVVHLSSIHAQQGNPSHVIVMTEPGPLSPRFDQSVHLHYLNFQRSSIRNPLRFVSSIFKGYRLLSRLLKEEGIQVLQTHMQDTNLWGFVLQMTGKCRTVFTVHSNRFISYDTGTRFGKWVTVNSYRAMARSRGAMVAVSPKVKSSLVEYLGLSSEIAERVHSIENGIPMPSPLRPGERQIIRTDFGVRENETWIIGAGRFAEPKNFSCLLRCGAWLKDQDHPVKILIAGDGPLRNELEELARELSLEDTVYLPGNIDNLAKVMAAADIFAIPSLWEGLPLVLLEAMAAGIPIVGSNTKGIADIISHGVNGLLFETNDHVGFGKTIMDLAGDADLQKNLGTAGMELARQNFDITKVYEKYLRIYKALAPS
jgi:glycosyltransferase involved in cell wall biosynthesis